MGPLASLALNAAPALLGGATSLLTKNNYKKDEQFKGYKSLYNTFSDEIAKPYLETSGAKSVLQAIREGNDRRIKRITAAQAVNGLTDEAKVGAFGNAQQAESNAISGLSAGADNYRFNMLNNRTNTLSNMMGIRDNYRQRTRQQVGDVVNGFSKAVQGYQLSK